nr:MAG TPA: hypothetical protein [Caudoviricetes sp.]
MLSKPLTKGGRKRSKPLLMPLSHQIPTLPQIHPKTPKITPKIAHFQILLKSLIYPLNFLKRFKRPICQSFA